MLQRELVKSERAVKLLDNKLEGEMEEKERALNLAETRKDRMISLKAGLSAVQGNFESFKLSVELLIKREGGSIVDPEELQNALNEQVDREINCTGLVKEALESEATYVARLGILKQQYGMLEATTDARFKAKQEENTRLECDNMDLGMKLTTAEKQLEAEREKCANLNVDRDNWQSQCEQQAFGNNVDVVRQQHNDTVRNLLNQVDALSHELSVRQIALEDEKEDNAMYVRDSAHMLLGTRHTIARADWAEADRAALRKRFRKELAKKDVVTPWVGEFEKMDPEKAQAIYLETLEAIQHLTGMMMADNGGGGLLSRYHTNIAIKNAQAHGIPLVPLSEDMEAAQIEPSNPGANAVVGGSGSSWSTMDSEEAGCSQKAEPREGWAFPNQA
jgi:hypothetical protein